MMALVFGLLFMPICAMVAGIAVWATNRGRSLDDGELIGHFLLILTGCIVILWGVSRTQTVRLRLGPQLQLQAKLDANPVYSALKRPAPDDHKALHDFLILQISQGTTLSDALLQARPLLTRLTNAHLGFADQKTKVRWGWVSVETLKELQALDPVLCYRALSSQALDQSILAHAFSADNTKAFQQAVIEVYASGDRGMRHEQPTDTQPVQFNDAALEYSAIQDAIAQKFGESVSTQLRKDRIREPKNDLAQQMCAARIVQLEAMLERPQGMASMLVDSVLR